MVADEVSGCGDGADDLRTLTSIVADEEESGADGVTGEDVEKALGDDSLGPSSNVRAISLGLRGR